MPASIRRGLYLYTGCLCWATMFFCVTVGRQSFLLLENVCIVQWTQRFLCDHFWLISFLNPLLLECQTKEIILFQNGRGMECLSGNSKSQKHLSLFASDMVLLFSGCIVMVQGQWKWNGTLKSTLLSKLTATWWSLNGVFPSKRCKIPQNFEAMKKTKCFGFLLEKNGNVGEQTEICAILSPPALNLIYSTDIKCIIYNWVSIHNCTVWYIYKILKIDALVSSMKTADIPSTCESCKLL